MDIRTHTANTYTPKHTQTVCSRHPQCFLGPHLFMLVAGFNTQVKLQWNIIIWRHLLTLTVHEVQLLLSLPPNRRTEQWEQTHRLIHAEVSALRRWNAKSRVSPQKICSLPPSHLFPLFSPLSLAPHLKNGVTFTTLMEKCCQRLSQSAKKSQKVSQSNPTLVNSKWYISGT